MIGRALDAGCVPVSFLMERKHVEGKAAELLARCPADIPVYAAPLEVLEQLTGFKLTRGMLCAMRRPKLPTVEQVCAGARRAVRVSMGTVFQVPWTYFPEDAPWPEGGMALLRQLGFRTAAMALRDDSLSIDDPRLLAEDKLAVVLGTEGDGLAAATIAHCDYTVRIPMAHGVDSLNVAAAAAVTGVITDPRTLM